MCNHSTDAPCEGEWVDAPPPPPAAGPTAAAVPGGACAPGSPCPSGSRVGPEKGHYVLRATRAIRAGEQVCISCEEGRREGEGRAGGPSPAIVPPIPCSQTETAAAATASKTTASFRSPLLLPLLPPPLLLLPLSQFP